jgi:hypothetical protein
VFTELLLRNRLHNTVVPPLLSMDDIENTASSIVVLERVYKAVAWQLVDQIHYIAPSLRLLIPSGLLVHPLYFLSEAFA